jgi:hypothetical protein
VVAVTPTLKQPLAKLHPIDRPDRTASIPKKRRKQARRAEPALPQTEPTWPPSASEAAKPRRAIEHGKPHYAQPFHCTHRFPNADRHSRRDDANGIAPTLMSTPAKRTRTADGHDRLMGPHENWPNRTEIAAQIADDAIYDRPQTLGAGRASSDRHH